MQNDDNLILVPYPKKLETNIGKFCFTGESNICFPFDSKEDIYPIAKRLKSVIKAALSLDIEIRLLKTAEKDKAVIFLYEQKHDKEAYSLEINSNNIFIKYTDRAGAFHAVSTLKQLIVQCGKTLPCISVEDGPDFKARGIMLDISRNKIPSMNTLYRLVDFMADIKLNQIQLYIEGFSFAYPTYPLVSQDGTPVTGEEILELDRYCQQRYIELVPNQNSFGHMGDWLARNEFRDIAEMSEKFEVDQVPGYIFDPSTLDPQDPGSLELIENITADLLPYFTSELFNAGCDETFELGMGKSRQICERRGAGAVYLDFILKVYEIVKKHGKKMMFWGDIIMQHPELIEKLPKDMIALEWGYEAEHPFEADGKKFKEAGIGFYVCPGTSSWNAISGRTENMKANMLNAAENGKKYGATGYLITDWGDCGHWQYLPFSYPGFSYGAALSWGVEENADADILTYLDKFVFKDIQGQMGRAVMELGRYYLKEKIRLHNNTAIVKMLYSDMLDIKSAESFTIDDLEQIKEYVGSIEEKLCQVQMQCEDAALIEDEFRNAVRFIIHGCDLGILKLHIKNKADDNVVMPFIKQMTDDITVLINRHEKLWLSRNRPGGLKKSIAGLERLKKEYIEYDGKR